MDMNKRTILALVLIFIVFLISNKLFWKPQTENQVQQNQQAEVKQTKPESQSQTHQLGDKNETTEKKIIFSQDDGNLAQAPAQKFSEQNIEINNNIILENESVRIFFTNKGANIRQVELKKIMRSNTEQVPVNLLLSNKGLLNIKLDGDFGKLDLGDQKFELDEHETNENQVVFCIKKDGIVLLQKKFILTEGYGLVMNFTARDLGLIDSYTLGLNAGVYHDPEISKRDRRFINAVAQVDNEEKKISLNNAQDGEQLFGSIGWTVVKTKYFMVAAIPEGRRKFDEITLSTESGNITEVASMKVSRSQIDHTTKFYLGPIIYDNLKAYNVGLENSMDFGWKFIRPISKLILKLLTWIYTVIPNWGFSIIILSIILKIVLAPLTHKGTKSTHKMKTVQPLVKAVQERYKDNPKKAQQEVMKLYKEHGVSPLGGCLPLLLQFPILFALYPVLQSAIALRNANFIFWIKDLASPDPYYILPIIMGIAMFLQQKLMAQKPTPDMDEKQQAQMKTQKMMMYGMPIFLVFIFKSFPAGLVLYWLSYNLLSIVEQLYIKKTHLEPQKQMVEVKQ